MLEAESTAHTAGGRHAGERRRVGPYRLVRELGQGGMGAVYLAARDDDVFEKRVAIKILKRGMDTDAFVRRFRNERQILAGLDHPNIATLLDGGSTDDGLPYLVMEYVDGVPIVQYAAAHHLRTSARLRLFLQVCAAAQHAHQNLVIHRDIKPANVLVTADGVPKLLDFGIAKLVNADVAGHTLAEATLAGMLLMTPEYASPEQVRGEPVTTATDVYSLGILLYELLTGFRPYRFTSRSVDDIVRVVCEAEPIRPSIVAAHARRLAAGDESSAIISDSESQRLRRRLEGDLDNIVLKAIAKEPSRRFQTVDQLAEDVRRHLERLPVSARPDTIRYRTSKFVRRHRGAVLASAAVLVALVAGLVGTGWQALVARRERARAEQRFNDVRALATALLFDAHDAVKDLAGSTPARRLIVQRAIEYLDKLAVDAGDRADLRRELAAGYVRVGDVQGRPLNPNLGDSAGATASYRKAIGFYESLGVSASSPLEMRREMATAQLRLSEILAATGDTRGAMEAVRSGLALQHDIARDVSAPPQVRRELVVGYSRLGDLLASTGATREALDTHRKALDIMQSVAATAPDDPANLRQLGVAHIKVANVLGNPNAPNVGDHAGALVETQRSRDVFARAVERYPDNALFARNLAVARANEADVLRALGRWDAALESEKAALSVFEAQARQDPSNAAAKNDLAIGYFKMAEMLDASGRTREALVQIGQAIALHDALAAADPTNTKVLGETATNRSLLGRLQAKLGQHTSSMDSHRRAVDLSRSLSRGSPENIELRIAVAQALIERGDSAREARTRGGWSESVRAAAERDYAEAVEILGALKSQGMLEGTDLATLEEAISKRDAASAPNGSVAAARR